MGSERALNRGRLLGRFLDLAVWLLAATGLCQTIAIVAWYWHDSIYQANTCGTLTALADDIAHGTLLRPLVSDLGYGGTRYMPLFPLLHGTLIRLGVEPVVAGMSLMQSATVLLAAAIASCLRLAGLPWTKALPLALLTWTSEEYLQHTTQLRIDVLAAALNLWGIYCVARAVRRRAPGKARGVLWIALAVLMFSLAFISKLTALYGAVAAVLWLLSRRRWRLAAALGTGTASCAGILLMCLQHATGGVFEQVFSRCLSCGGGIADAADAWYIFGREFVSHEPNGLFLLGALAAVFLSRAVGRSLEGLTFLMATMTLAVEFASPGCGSNHMVDVYATCILVMGRVVATTPLGWRLLGGLFALCLANFACDCVRYGAPAGYYDAVISERRHSREAIRYIQRIRPHDGGPVYATDPMVPIVMGQRPYLLDDFMFNSTLIRDHAIASDLCRAMREHRFSMLVIDDFDRTAVDTTRNPDNPKFIERFISAVQRFNNIDANLCESVIASYRMVAAVPPYTVWLPRSVTRNDARPLGSELRVVEALKDENWIGLCLKDADGTYQGTWWGPCGQIVYDTLRVNYFDGHTLIAKRLGDGTSWFAVMRPDGRHLIGNKSCLQKDEFVAATMDMAAADRRVLWARDVYGVRRIDGVDERGFYDTEGTHVDAWRWTNGKATLVIPLQGRSPSRLRLRLGGTVAQTVDLRVDGQTLWHGSTPDAHEMDEIFTLKHALRRASVRVEIVSSTFVPSRVDRTSRDTRTLGVQVRGISFLP